MDVDRNYEYGWKTNISQNNHPLAKETNKQKLLKTFLSLPRWFAQALFINGVMEKRYPDVPVATRTQVSLSLRWAGSGGD